MGPIGVPEMLFILAIALLIFGPKRLPEFGRTIGKALGEFRRATTDLKRSIDVEVMSAEPSRPEPSTQASSAAAPVARDSTLDGTGPDDDESPAEDAIDATADAEPEDGRPDAG